MRIKISVAVFYVLLVLKLAEIHPFVSFSWLVISAPLWAYPAALTIFYVSTALILSVFKVTRGVR